MPGRKPVPTVLNLVRGNPGKRPPKRGEPKPAVGAAMPKWLTPTAAKHWPLVAKQLKECGILTKIDAPALALYCDALARWKEATDRIEATGGPVTISPNGFLIQSPYVSIANKAWDQMLRILVEFGMSPSSRTKVTRTEIADNRDEEKTGLARFR